jgi:hypothetical protein
MTALVKKQTPIREISAQIEDLVLTFSVQRMGHQQSRLDAHENESAQDKR